MRSAETTNNLPPKRLFRRRAFMGGAAVLVAAGAAAALARVPRRADGLPAGVALSKAHALGDGFYVVDGWVLTAEDLKALKATAPGSLP